MSDYSKRERDGYMNGLFKAWRKLGWSVVRTVDLKEVVSYARQPGDVTVEYLKSLGRLEKEVNGG